MGLSDKLNAGKRGTVAPEIDTDALKYFKAADLIGDYEAEPIVLKGFIRYTTKKYGEAVALVTADGRGIYLPSRYVETFDDLTDDEIDAIMAGKQGITSISEWDTPNGKTVKIIFADL